MPRNRHDDMVLSTEEMEAFHEMRNRNVWEYHSVTCVCDLCLYLDDHYAFPGPRIFGGAPAPPL